MPPRKGGIIFNIVTNLFMKFKIGDKVKFEFLSIHTIGVIEKIQPLPYGVDQELRYSINDGTHIYPIKLKNIQEKI